MSQAHWYAAKGTSRPGAYVHKAVADSYNRDGKGVIKMFDVSRREPKQLFSNGKFCESDSPQELVGIVKSVKCNADGTCVSIISERMRGKYLRAPDSRLHVYHCEMQSVLHYDFAEKGRYPIAHFWDSDEPRLLACETHKLAGGSNKASKKKSKAESKSSDERKSSKESDEADPLTHIFPCAPTQTHVGQFAVLSDMFCRRFGKKWQHI